MGDTLKCFGFNWINVWCGNLSSGQIPTEVLRKELIEEMAGSLNFFFKKSQLKKQSAEFWH